MGDNGIPGCKAIVSTVSITYGVRLWICNSYIYIYGLSSLPSTEPSATTNAQWEVINRQSAHQESRSVTTTEQADADDVDVV